MATHRSSPSPSRELESVLVLGDWRQPGHLTLHVSLGLGDTRVLMASVTLRQMRERHERTDAPSQHSTGLRTASVRPIGNAQSHL